MNERQSWYLELSQNVAVALYRQYEPALREMITAHEMEEADVNMVQVAYSAEPTGLNANVLLERTPYMAATRASAQMADSAGRGFLQQVNGDAYRLTDRGLKAARTLPINVAESLTMLEPLPAAKLERLAKLLRRLVDASLKAEQPRKKPAITRSRFFDPGPDAAVLERIRRYTNDLAAFRDDVHMAAWSSYDVEGYEWEAFSHVWGVNVWGDDVSTAKEVAEKLAFRGHDATAYESALHSLVARGWLEEADGIYRVTAEGSRLRDKAESATDDYFFAPWAALSIEEQAELKDLLSQLSDAMTPDAEN